MILPSWWNLKLIFELVKHTTTKWQHVAGSWTPIVDGTGQAPVQHPTYEWWRIPNPTHQDQTHLCNVCSTSSPVISNPLLLHLSQVQVHSILFHALPTSLAAPWKRSIRCWQETNVRVRSPPKFPRTVSIHLLENYPLNNLETSGNFSTKGVPMFGDPEVALIIETQTFSKLQNFPKSWWSSKEALNLTNNCPKICFCHTVTVS